jgi:glycosyltransferase involved in cell wall biosynthesis
MSAGPQVAIGLPVYNGAAFLDEAMASLCAQDFADLRIVVSDNASTDATPAILAAWAARDPRIELHRQSTNIGMIGNFAFVRHAARARWFMLAAHDDRWSPNFVSALHAAALREPGCLLAVPQVVKTTLAGDEDLRFAVPAHVALAQGLTRRLALLRWAQSGWIYGLIDRATLLRAQDATERFGHAWGNEFITLLPFLLDGRVAAANEAIYYQRQTPLSEARYKPRVLADQKRLYRDFLREALRLLGETGLPMAQRAALMPALLRYSGRHAWKLRRLVLASLRLRRP